MSVLHCVEQPPTTKFSLVSNVSMQRLKSAFHNDQVLNYSLFGFCFFPYIFVVGLLVGLFLRRDLFMSLT